MAKFKQSAKGSSISEYLLISLLVLSGLLVVWLNFGEAFNERLALVRSDMIAHVDASKETAALKRIGSHLYMLDKNGNYVKISGGDSANALTGTTATTGANGDLLRLSKLINKSVKLTGKLTAEQENLMVNLSNAAHTLARYQDALALIGNQCGTNSMCYKNTVVVVEGQTLTAKQIATILKGDALTALKNIYNELLSSGLPLDVRTEVNQMVLKIESDTNIIANTALYAEKHSVIAGMSSDASKDGGKKTDDSGVAICDDGGGKSNGKKCWEYEEGEAD